MFFIFLWGAGFSMEHGIFFLKKTKKLKGPAVLSVLALALALALRGLLRGLVLIGGDPEEPAP
jgi:hypothetical protein